MRILVLTHYYAPEYGAPQRRWSALVSRFIAAGHRVTVVAPVPHYPSGRPTVEQRRDHRVGGAEHGAHGETVPRTAYLPHRGDIGTRTADHLVSALDALWRLRRRFGRREDRPEVIVATAPAIPTLLVGRLLSARWGVPLVVEMRDAWPDLVTQVGGAERVVPGAVVAAVRAAGDAGERPGRREGAARVLSLGRLRSGVVALAKRVVHRQVTDWQTEAYAVVTTTSRFADVCRASAGSRLSTWSATAPSSRASGPSGTIRPATTPSAAACTWGTWAAPRGSRPWSGRRRCSRARAFR
ncbi:hypothetical protein [Brachybacterium sp. GPGPB12]|uniref:hypothetical protein n=1 Tax=Brachybacterium sp. GPGPB12 TaxID=3023517 RepID=UPI0031342708